MRASLRKRTALPEAGVVAGPARVDPRTKGLTKRLRPGDIAVIDHLDIDRVSAEALVACQPAAVLNAARSTSGRYPNLGPEILIEAGIPLIDDLGADVMSLTEGHRLRIVDGAVYEGETLVAEGVLQTEATVAAAMEEARAGLSVQLESFAANTMDYLRRERDLLLDGVGVPDISHRDRRSAGAHRGARLPLQGRPGHAAALHPRVPAGAHRRRRRSGRDPRRRLEARPDRRRHGLRVRPGADVRRGGRGARLPRRARARARARRAARRQARRVPRHGHQRGRRHAARRRQGRRADRRGRDARHPRRVPRQGPVGHGQHVPHAAAGRRQAGRRQGRLAALPQPHLQPAAHRSWSSRACSPSASRSRRPPRARP